MPVITPHQLSPDLVPWIFDVVASLFLVRVGGIEMQVPPTPGIEQGTLQLEVVEVYRGAQIKPGVAITVAFSRLADPAQRKRLGFDQWNVLDFDRGAFVLLAGTRVTDEAYDALAADNVASPAAPEVAELRAAVRLHDAEKTEDTLEPLFRDAVLDGKSLLRRYALEAIGNRGIGDRLVGARVLQNAVDAPQLNTDEKLDIGQHALDPMVFDEERHADRVNRIVVSLLVRGYLQEPDAANRVTWTKYLGNVLLRSFGEEDRAVKESLVRAVDRPEWESMRELLTRQAQTGPADERELTSDVLAVWLLAL